MSILYGNIAIQHPLLRMTSFLLDRVMHGKACGRTGRTDEAAARREVRPQIETGFVSGEVTALAVPGWCQAKSGSEEGVGWRKHGLFRAVRDARNLRKSACSRCPTHTKL